MAVKEEDYQKLLAAFIDTYNEESVEHPNRSLMDWKRVYKTIYTTFNLPWCTPCQTNNTWQRIVDDFDLEDKLNNTMGRTKKTESTKTPKTTKTKSTKTRKQTKTVTQTPVTPEVRPTRPAEKPYLYWPNWQEVVKPVTVNR